MKLKLLELEDQERTRRAQLLELKRQRTLAGEWGLRAEDGPLDNIPGENLHHFATIQAHIIQRRKEFRLSMKQLLNLLLRFQNADDNLWECMRLRLDLTGFYDKVSTKAFGVTLVDPV